MVDDNYYNLHAAKLMLKNLGYECDIAINGHNAIKLIKDKLKIKDELHVE